MDGLHCRETVEVFIVTNKGSQTTNVYFRAIYLVGSTKTVKQVIQSVGDGMPLFMFPKGYTRYVNTTDY
jgi:hypothetical protein